MKKYLPAALILLLCALLFGPDVAWPERDDVQHREIVNAPPSAHFPLGTDDLGRNRLLRLTHAARVSFSFAPAAALVSVFVALVLGTAAGMLGGVFDRLFDAVSDLTLSLPWLFLLICVRAALPLDASPWVLTTITYAALACVAWAAPARVVRNVVRRIKTDEFLLQAECLGCGGVRTWWVHVAPNLRPVVLAQFWTSIPVFILGEANLGLLGLGVPEPIPSLGGLMRECEGYRRIIDQPWLAAPILLVAATNLAIWIFNESGVEESLA
jgi:peptide/nickel transport system permease protein